ELKKEVERRKLGKEMLDFKKKQEEEKTKRLLEERNREKAEERAARERVKQQIALVLLTPTATHRIGEAAAARACYTVNASVRFTVRHDLKRFHRNGPFTLNIFIVTVEDLVCLWIRIVSRFHPQDRADRAARYAQSQQDAEAARLAALQARAAEQEAKRDAAQRER
ncbi:hypothetical protein M9458_020823, partial [Cirrhinus mrigala]